MMKNKTKEQREAIRKGFIVLVIGVIIGLAYLNKFCPITNMAILTLWAYTGWMFAALAILYGLCEIFIKGDL